MAKEKLTYLPLEELFKDPNPTLEKISNVIKRASGKNVDINRLEKKLHEVCVKAQLSPEEYGKLHKVLEGCAESLMARKKEVVAQGYTNLATYTYHIVVSR